MGLRSSGKRRLLDRPYSSLSKTETETRAEMASFRAVLRHTHIYISTFSCFTPPPRTPTMALFLSHGATRHCLIPSKPSRTVKSRASSDNYNLVLKKDERLGTGECVDEVASGTTIAAIVTSVGGPPAAVGIVRLSGPGAVSIVGPEVVHARRRG